MQQRAVEITVTYTGDTKDWKKSITDLCQPYWNWELNTIPPDEVIKQKKVTITDKDGKRVPVDNPLYHYKFHPIDSSFPYPYSQWQTTIRHPTHRNDADATDNIMLLMSYIFTI